MRYFFILIFFLTAVNMFAQGKFKKIIDERNGREMIVGVCSREVLQTDTSFSKWFKEEFDLYVPMIENKSRLKEKFASVYVTIVMGTWCPDSRMQVPQFYKILDELQFPDERIKLICVDRKMKTPNNETDELDIKRVPTFIFYDANKNELGRIIEFPEETLEIDSEKILGK